MIAFKPAPFLANGHLQTLYPAFFFRPKKPDTTIEIFELDDGDFVECVWHLKPHIEDKRPIVVLFHGLEGSAHSPYIQRAMNVLGEAGYAVVVMQFRGCGKEQNRLLRSYHSGDTADASAWIRHLHQHYHDSPLFAVGYSLGGNVLLKLLGDADVGVPLKAAVAVSAPMQLEASVYRINQGFSKLYQYNMMRSLRQHLKEKILYHDSPKLPLLSEVDKLRTFKAFDDRYTAPIHGFLDADDYYRRASAKQYLKGIVVRTLIIHAENDPFMSLEVLPDIASLPANVQVELSPSGGHVGFVGGSVFKPLFWLEPRILSFFQSYSDDA